MRPTNQNTAEDRKCRAIAASDTQRARTARAIGMLGLAAVILWLMGLNAAQAHEYFLTKNGVYQIVVGMHIEPAFAGEPNAVEFFANVEDPPGSGDSFPNLDTKQGDIVKLSMVPIRLDTDRVDPNWSLDVADHTVKQFPALTDIKRCGPKHDPLGLTPGCEGVGYLAAFDPKKKGAYGFYLVGEIKRHDHDGFTFPRTFFSYIMVCQAGSHALEPRDPITGIPLGIDAGVLNGGWFSCVYNPGDETPGHRVSAPPAGKRWTSGR